ncbi:MAG: hypothetical protein P1U86_14780 [Verrucomicrobiales bacterium]|nr:hypothetical protein [Verrucomicrobiales bacterium]
MKKLLAIAAATAALFTFTPTPAEAGSSYRSRAVGTCQHCRGKIYAYYRPINSYHGRTQYGWVTSQHTKCQQAAYAQRSRQLRSYSHSYVRPSYGHSRSYSRSYVRPGISFSFGTSRGHSHRRSHCR